jgi:transmembrane sensor
MNTVSFPDKDLIEEQAAAWIAAIDRGISGDEEQGLSDWLSQSALHGDALVQLASMWDLMDVLTPISKLLPMEQEGESSAFEQSKVQNKPVSNQRWYALAASIAVIAVTATIVTVSFNSKSVPAERLVLQTEEIDRNRSVESHTYITAIGEQSNIILSDGSEVKLNTDSVVRVVFDAHSRQIQLERGEAFFEVTKNNKRPFVVSTQRGTVTAVGTAFSVDASHLEDLEVLVAEGRVKVDRLAGFSEDEGANGEYGLTAGNEPVFLDKGQRVLIKGKQTTVSSNQDVESELAWRKGMIVFTGEPLHQAVAEIDRYIPLQFKIVDEQIASIPVGGFFKTGDLDQLLLIFEQNFGVLSTRLGDDILLSKAP